MNTPLFAVIVAGGTGTRMQATVPKQFMLLAGKPVLAHTINAFRNSNPKLEIILVLPEPQIAYWQGLCRQHGIDENGLTVVRGGATRFLSVQRGLAAIASNVGIVAIHDGVRPLIDEEIIIESYRVAEALGNAVVAVPLKDSIRKVEDGLNRAVKRENYQLIQTPQTFRLAKIREAYTLADPHKEFTDDASVLESLGEKINLIKGSYENIKITTPEDLMVAEAIINTRLR